MRQVQSRIITCSSLVAAVLLAGCAGSPFDRARQTLTGVELAVKGAAETLKAYDADHQLDLAKQAKATCAAKPAVGDRVECSKTEAGRLLDAWDADYRKARGALFALEAAVTTAEAGVSAAELVHGGAPVLESILAEVKAPLKALVDVLKQFGIAPPALAAIVGGL